MPNRLNGKACLITGGTSGIGEATVELFVAEGAKVMFTGRNAESGAKIAKATGATFFQSDVTREADIKASIDATAKAFGKLDVLFSNAGGPTKGTAADVTYDDFKHATDLLLGSVIFGIRHAAPLMKANGGGSIINNASVAAQRSHMGQYLYSICKAGVVQATKMAGMELGPSNIRVNCISPGAIATPIFFGGSEAAAHMEAGKADAKLSKLTTNLAKATPLHRSGLPIDIAMGAVFLASDEARHITCHDLVIDAGMTFGGRVNFE